MKRKVIDKLIKWKKLGGKKPILLTGVKGVGKTYLAYDFAKAFFEDIHYYNLERDPENSRLFLSESPELLLEALKKASPASSEVPSHNRILILDEIACCEASIRLILNPIIKAYFPYIIVISSNPISEQYLNSFVKLPIYPMEFDEFLRATGNDWYIEAIMTHYQSDKKIPEIVHKELLALLQLYLQIGGMPGLINEYLNLSSVINIPEQHGFLTGSYHDYILRDYSNNDSLKMIQVFDSLPLQLLKENKKFQYKLIRKGTTHTMYKEAIRQLSEMGYIIRCNRISNEQLIAPKSSLLSEDWTDLDGNTNFKLYLSDTGLLNSGIVKEQGDLVTKYSNRALLENYVAQSLQAKHYPLAFWESDSMAKVDFITMKAGELIPIEIHEGENTRSKSISILKQRCRFPYAIKVSAKNFEFSNQIKYVPYYAIFCL